MRTTSELARRWRVSANKVRAFIKHGELRALNLATKPCGRPRYRIAEDALEQFETERAVAVRVAPHGRRRHEKSNTGIIEFF